MLPALPELQELLPAGGLRRGTVIALGGPQPGGITPSEVPTSVGRTSAIGVTSLLTALLAGPSQAGSWCAVVGMPAFGAVAAAAAGVRLDRLALVRYPGAEWASVAAALLDGIDVVAVQPPGPVTAAVAQRLAARARQRGSVLVPVGTWPGADLTMTPRHTPGHDGWEGAGRGHGRVRRRKVEIVTSGRGSSTRPRRTRLWLPTREGGVGAVASESVAPPTDTDTPATAARTDRWPFPLEKPVPLGKPDVEKAV